MELVPAASINDAKVGNIVRFMHNTGEGTVYWIQGTVEKRLTKYKIARDCKFAKNFFRIGSLEVISYWGEEQKLLPETVRCNLTPNAAWSVGTEVLLPTLTDDDLALTNNNLEDDASTDVSTISDDVNQIRILRTANPNDWLTDEKVFEILRNVQIVINGDK